MKPVLEFIQLTKKVADYSSLKIIKMELSKNDFVTMRIHYSGDVEDWYVIKNIPVEKPSEGLDRILSGIELARKENVREIDLGYKDQAVLKKSSEEKK